MVRKNELMWQKQYKCLFHTFNSRLWPSIKADHVCLAHPPLYHSKPKASCSVHSWHSTDIGGMKQRMDRIIVSKWENS